MSISVINDWLVYNKQYTILMNHDGLPYFYDYSTSDLFWGVDL